MSNVYSPTRIGPDTNGASNGGDSPLMDKGTSEGMADFYTEVRS